MDTYTLPREEKAAWRNVRVTCQASNNIAEVVLDTEPNIEGVASQRMYRRNLLVTASAMLDAASFYNEGDVDIAGDILTASEAIKALIKGTQ